MEEIDHLHELQILELGNEKFAKFHKVTTAVARKELDQSDKPFVGSNAPRRLACKVILTSMTGLKQCVALEELCLSHNGIAKVEVLSTLVNLRVLDVSSNKEVVGSTSMFIALHRSMLRLKRFAVAFYGGSSRPQLVALVAQDEITRAGGQMEPPGMHMIYLPYSDDIRDAEEIFPDTEDDAPRADEDQIKKAAALIKRIDMKDFSVCQFANPALQRHYAVLQALALEEDDIPGTIDETLPDEEGLARPAVVKAIEEFKLSVYGDNYDEESDHLGKEKVGEASKKRKAIAENAAEDYDWADLADNGQLKDLTVAALKTYLNAHNLPVTGKKEALISRILTHMGK
ncbi:hypothetical protein REPUB_Repub11eG0034600 [Reevesia pubescens]